MQEVLDIYGRGSGQLVNRDKSEMFFSSFAKKEMFFSRNCLEDMKIEVQQALNIETEALAEKYLGLPVALGWSTTEAFEFMPTQIKNQIGTCSGREASMAGWEVLLKSVA